MLHTSVMLMDKLMVFGGVANNIPFEDLWVYDISMRRCHMSQCGICIEPFRLSAFRKLRMDRV